MRQAVMKKPGHIDLQQVKDPLPGRGEVLLRIKKIGVCGSDVHVWHGLHPYTSYPVVQGHEFSATIEALGEGVTGLEPGMKVTTTPQIVCGICGPCKRGDYHICENLKVQGFQAPGVAQDLFVAKAEKVVPLPDDFSFEQGAFVEPVSVAVHAVGRAGTLKGKNIVVFGAGPIGNLVAQVAQARGANVLITDLSEYRLKIAGECGLENTSNSREESFSKAVERTFGDKGFQVGFECVGVESTMSNAVEHIEKGGTIVVVGVFAEKPKVDLGLVQDRELTLVGTLMYKYEDYLDSVELMNSKSIKVEPLFSEHFNFVQYEKAYKFIDENRDQTMKVFIDL